jgi:hypothetical protein
LKRVPEDLYFFLDHLLLGGKLSKVPETLITYRYAEGSWALGTSKQDLAQVRVGYLENWIASNAASAAWCGPSSKRRKKAVARAEMSRVSLEGGPASERPHIVRVDGPIPPQTELRSTKRPLAEVPNVPGVEASEKISREWSQFSIWGYGKDGKKFMSMLQPHTAARVISFIDIDTKKIDSANYYCESIKRHIPVIHFSEAKPPFVVCVASKRAGDALEQNIRSVDATLVEGVDFIHFN